MTIWFRDLPIYKTISTVVDTYTLLQATVVKKHYLWPHWWLDAIELSIRMWLTSVLHLHCSCSQRQILIYVGLFCFQHIVCTQSCVLHSARQMRPEIVFSNRSEWSVKCLPCETFQYDNSQHTSSIKLK